MKSNDGLNTDIHDLQSQIRNYINKPRVLHAISQDSRSWNQLSSALDVIDDTYSAITAYQESDWPDNTGLQYIYLYGLLQALFLQQDAVRDLSNSLGIDYPENQELKAIRDIRNDAVGHPTNRNYGQSHHFISQTSIRKDSFTLMSFRTDTDPVFKNIDLASLIEKQIQEVAVLLKNVISILEENEMAHKGKFSDEKLTEHFPPTMDYYFQKIFESIHTPSKREMGSIHLKLVHDLYKKLIDKLKERGEYPANDVLVYETDEILYPVQKLTDYFDNNDSNNLSDKDAHIFASFIAQKHSYILKILDEIDQEYQALT